MTNRPGCVEWEHDEGFCCRKTPCVYAAPPAETALTDDARDAKRYRWLRENRPVLLLTGFFGNGCVNRRIEEADHEIDAALTAAQSASGDSYADKA